MKERDICLDDIDVIRNSDGTYMACDNDTGEILDSNNKILDTAISNQEKIERKNKAKKKGIRKLQGKEDLSETHHTDWKHKSHFIKIYRTEMREYLKAIKLSPNAGLLLLYIQPYIEFKSNKVCNKSGDSLTNDYLEDITGFTKKRLSSALKELEDNLFIVRVGKSQQRIIYFNPYLLCPGNVVSKEVANLFTNYKPII